MGARHSLGLFIAAVVLSLLVMLLSDPDTVGYRDCTHECRLVSK